MVKLTLIVRAHDGLALAEGLDSEKDAGIEQYKSQAKKIFRNIAQQPSSQQSRLSIDAGNCIYHYILESNVVFLTLTEKGYPKKLAFQYLEELASEFSRLYGPQVEAAQRPYAFIKFDTFIQKTKKLYMDTRTQRNLAKLHEDLNEVTSIMTKNIADVLGQGDQLNNMTKMSGNLVSESKGYLKKSKDLHRQALIRKYVPLAAIFIIVLLVLWVRARFYS